MYDNNTVQDIMLMLESKWIMDGARRLALQLADDNNKDFRDIIKNRDDFSCFLRHLASDRQQMFQYIFGLYDGIAVKHEDIKEGKKKKHKVTFRVIPLFSHKEINPYDFTSAEEQKYRKLCRLLMNVIDDAAKTISIVTGRVAAEVREQLFEGYEEIESEANNG